MSQQCPSSGPCKTIGTYPVGDGPTKRISRRIQRTGRHSNAMSYSEPTRRIQHGSFLCWNPALSRGRGMRGFLCRVLVLHRTIPRNSRSTRCKSLLPRLLMAMLRRPRSSKCCSASPPCVQVRQGHSANANHFNAQTTNQAELRAWNVSPPKKHAPETGHYGGKIKFDAKSTHQLDFQPLRRANGILVAHCCGHFESPQKASRTTQSTS